jgi:hypothetical protein
MKQTIYEEIQRMNLLSRYDNSKTLSEQTTESLIANSLHDAVSGAGTDPEDFSNEILKIRSAQEFELVNAELKKLSSNLDVAGWINDDFDNTNVDDVKKISDHLKKIGVNNTYQMQDNPKAGWKQNTFKIVAAAAAAAVSEWTKGFPCLSDIGEFKPTSNPKAVYHSDANGNSSFFYDDKSYMYQYANKTQVKGTWDCVDNKLIIKTVDGKQWSKTTGTTTRTTTGATSKVKKTVQIPTELKDVEGVKKFQDWLDVNAAGWATGYTDGIINKGQNGGGYGSFGVRTQKAWTANKDKYLGTAPAAAPAAAPATTAPATTAPGPDDDVPQQ